MTIGPTIPLSVSSINLIIAVRNKGVGRWSMAAEGSDCRIGKAGPAGYALKGWRSGACFGAGSTARMLGTARLRTELRWRR